jgi:hypothetical protein
MTTLPPSPPQSLPSHRHYLYHHLTTFSSTTTSSFTTIMTTSLPLASHHCHLTTTIIPTSLLKNILRENIFQSKH